MCLVLQCGKMEKIYKYNISENRDHTYRKKGRYIWEFLIFCKVLTDISVISVYISKSYINKVDYINIVIYLLDCICITFMWEGFLGETGSCRCGFCKKTQETSPMWDRVSASQLQDGSATRWVWSKLSQLAMVGVLLG